MYYKMTISENRIMKSGARDLYKCILYTSVYGWTAAEFCQSLVRLLLLKHDAAAERL